MENYQFFIWLHIMLMVFWLGADVGVFSAAAWVKRKGMVFSERMLLLKLAGFVDLFPRLCMAFMLPVGFTLGTNWGLVVDDSIMAGLWALSCLWAVSVVVAYRSEGKPLGALIARIQTVVFLIGAALAFWYGASLWGSGEVPQWLAAKIILFGVVFLVAIGIDLTFRPVIANMIRLAGEGNTDAVEAALSQSINRCLVVVSTLYVVLAVSGFLGATKFLV